jgi:hypothetical protein
MQTTRSDRVTAVTKPQKTSTFGRKETIKKTKITRRAAILTLTATTLALAVGVNLWPRAGRPSFSPSHPVSLLVPPPPRDWTARDSLLGPTEVSAGESIKTLNFTDYVYKIYSYAGMDVRVYVAYWAPGRLDPSLVWLHQPDNCWVDNGGVILKRTDARVLTNGSGGHSWPALFRVFQFPEGREEVLFWDSVGGRPSGFRWENQSFVASRWIRFVHSLRVNFFGLAPQEQLVVRISTNRTIDELVRSDLWPRITSSLAPSGIFEPSESGR